MSGPGTVSFANANAASTSATFAEAGIYVLRLTANDSELGTSDDVTITVEAANLAPVANAGADQTVTLPATASLSGSVTDDGKPSGVTVTSTWAKVSGPGTVTFADATALTTTATFSIAGTYVLSLTADDSEYTGSDTITIVVNPVPPNAAPTVNAGADQIISPPATSATLVGTVTDDGLPPGSSLTYLWTKVSGPGTVTFSSPTALTTNATFSDAGVYILRLTANDSALSGSDDVRVTLNGTNKAPTVNAGADQTVAHPTTVNLSGTATDDGLPIDSTLSFSWSKISGPGTVTFGTSAALQTTATFSAAGTYVLRLSASDTALSASDDVTITQTPPPTATFTSPANGSTITSRTDFIGTISEGSNWRLEYSLNEDGVAPTWITLSSGSTPITNNVIGTFDPSTLLNGIYTVRLVATNGSGQTTTTTLTAVAEGEQKVGNFRLTFTDLDVPVSGLPIQVIRSYDSRDKRKGDFGVGWTLDIRNIRLQESGILGNSWQGTSSGGFLPNYCVQGTQPHIVTITMPNNEVHKFEAILTPQCSRIIPPRETTIGFRALPGTNSTLVPVGDPTALVNMSFPGTGELLDWSTLEPKDFSQYQLTLQSGDVLLLDQQSGLKQMTDTNGNTVTINSNGIIHSSGKSISFIRDTQGRITQITDPAGVSMFYTYNASGDLVTFKDREGNVTTFTYNSTHGLLTVKDPRGIQPVRYDYDDDGRLVSATDAFGKVINFERNPNVRQEISTDRLGNVTLFEYNAHGEIVRQTDALGGVTTRTFDSKGNMLSETNPLGKVSTFTYDTLGNRLTETDPLGNITRMTYNTRGQVLSVTDPRGGVTTHVYDTKGNLTSVTDAAGKTSTTVYDTKGQATLLTDKLGNATSYVYSTAGNITQQTDVLGNVAIFTYDLNGNRLSQAVTRNVNGVVETLTTSYQYDLMGRLTKTTQPDGSVTETVYNSIGKKTAAIDQLGRRTTFEYDDMGRLTRTTFPDNTKEETTYDAEGRAIKTVDRAGRATLYTFDALGRLVKTTYPDGTFTTATFDAQGQPVAETDISGHTTTREFDAAGRNTKVTDALNNVTTFTYDLAGNRISMTDAKGKTTTYEYDANNRQIRTVYPDNTTQSVIYDNLGQVISRTDQAGKTTLFEYEKRGKLTKVTDALAGLTRFTYDELGNLITQTDANNHITRYEYDKVGRRTKRTLPMGMSETFVYDTAGNLSSRTDFNGKQTTFTYDELNRILTRTPDPSTGETPVTFTYTALGQRQNMTDATGTTTYGYDARNRLTSKQTPFGTLSYTYSAAGSVLTLRSSNANGVSVDYTYDGLNRLATAKDNRLATGETSYSYDANGNLESVTYPNQVQTTYAYNTLNRLTSMSVKRGATNLASYAYTLGPAGNRLAVTEQNGRTVNYTYDALYRLTKEAITADALTNGEVNYGYDGVGNRLSRTSSVTGIASTTATYDANDRLNSDTYDPNGNTLGSSGSTYSYDSYNRLREVNGGGITYAYDGDGNLVAKTVGGVTTNYLVDANNPTGQTQVVEELVGGAVQRQYTFGHDLISQRQLIGGQWQTSFYGYDGHGSVRHLTDDGGSVTDTYTYDAFGNLIARTGSTPNDYLYAGERFDANAGFYHLRARYMNPQTGRFQTADSYEGSPFDPISLHKYLYANADPVNNVDPAGNFGFSIGSFSISFSIQSVLTNIAVGSILGGIMGGLDAFFGGRDVLQGIFEGAITGGLLGIAIQIKFILPLLKVLGVAASIYGLADALANEDYDLAIFRAVCFFAPAVIFAGIRQAKLGQLRYLGPQRWVSQRTGLVYGSDAAFGNRVLHVMAHMANNPNKKLQGVFTIPRNQVLALVDEAYLIAQRNPGKYLVSSSGNRQTFRIPMNDVIGYQGGNQGNGGPLSYLFLVLENGNEVITAFPN